MSYEQESQSETPQFTSIDSKWYLREDFEKLLVSKDGSPKNLSPADQQAATFWLTKLAAKIYDTASRGEQMEGLVTGSEALYESRKAWLRETAPKVANFAPGLVEEEIRKYDERYVEAVARAAAAREQKRDQEVYIFFNGTPEWYKMQGFWDNVGRGLSYDNRVVAIDWLVKLAAQLYVQPAYTEHLEDERLYTSRKEWLLGAAGQVDAVGEVQGAIDELNRRIEVKAALRKLTTDILTRFPTPEAWLTEIDRAGVQSSLAHFAGQLQAMDFTHSKNWQSRIAMAVRILNALASNNMGEIVLFTKNSDSYKKRIAAAEQVSKNPIAMAQRMTKALFSGGSKSQNDLSLRRLTLAENVFGKVEDMRDNWRYDY